MSEQIKDDTKNGGAAAAAIRNPSTSEKRAADLPRTNSARSPPV